MHVKGALGYFQRKAFYDEKARTFLMNGVVYLVGNDKQFFRVFCKDICMLLLNMLIFGR
jgi:hypothetical protein